MLKNKEKEKKAEILVPKGYTLLDLLDTTKPDFDEQPIKSEEVKVSYGK